MTTTPTPAPSRRRTRNIATLVAAAMLILWTIWWCITANDGRLLFGQRTWVPAFQTIGLDFLHNDLAVRHLLGGGNPYLELFGDPMGIPYNYAPVVLLLFAWCGVVPLVPAVLTWITAIAAMMAVAAAYSTRVRSHLTQSRLPALVAVAAILWCTGTIFSMERGNCDVLVVLALLLACVALRKPSAARDAAAGICIALATLIKVYPAIAIFGLLALRRRRAAIAAIIAGLLISAATPRATLQWLDNVRVDAQHHHVGLVTHAHTLSGMLDDIIVSTTAVDLAKARTAAMILASLLLLPLIIWVSRAIFQSDARHAIAWPYLLWLTQAGTFWSPISYDYKLLFLPLAMLTLWQRRDPWYAHALLVPFLLYWQPLRLPFLSPALLLAIKFAALIGIAILLVRAASVTASQRQYPAPG
jgi:hypothetical protein